MKYVGSNALAKAMQLIQTAVSAKATKATATATLTAAGWVAAGSAFAQTIAVSDVTAGCDVIVSPLAASYGAYRAAGCYCSAQSAGTLTFTCTAKPEAALSVGLLIFS